MLDARDDIEREAAHCNYKHCLPDEACRQYEGNVKVLREEGHADNVNEEGDDFGQDHVDVPAKWAHQLGASTARSRVCLPSTDLESDHNKLIQNKSRKGYRYDIQEFILEDVQRHHHDCSSLVYRDHEPFEEGLVAE